MKLRGNPDGAALIAFALTIPVLLAALVYAIMVRQPWYDEFYTLYVTRTDWSWSEAFARHWLTDNHPPLFYALSRATSWLGQTVEARRLANLLIAVASLLIAVAAVRGSSRSRLIAICYFLFIITPPPFLPLAAELRSYFLSYCSMSVLVLVLVLIWQDEEPPKAVRKAVLTLATLVAFNTHIITSLIAGALVLPFAAAALFKRDYQRFRTLLIPALAGGTLFLVTVAVQFPLWIANTSDFWIPASAEQALWAIRMILQAVGVANPVILLGGACGIGVVVSQAFRDRKMSASLETMLLLGIGTVLACVLIAAVQIWRPSVIPKYLTCLIPCIAMIVSLGLSQLIRRTWQGVGPLLLTVAAGMSLFAMVGNASAVADIPGWDGTAAAVARQVARCKGTVVHTDPYWNSYVMGLKPADNAHVVPYSYEFMARRHGFAVEPLSSRRVSQDCPTLFWVEHISRTPDAETVLMQERKRGFAISRLEIYSVGKGWIASTEPLGGAPGKAD